MIKIEQLDATDFEEAMDFMNLVFGAHRPHDFATLLPTLYQPTDELMNCIWAIRESGRIVATVGSYPLEWNVLGKNLSLAGIGGGSSHPRRRGKGYMQELMKYCVAEMRSNGIHASWLGGQRQRYGYFGYEKCGMTYEYNLSKNNLRHVFGTINSDITFRPLDPLDNTHLKGIAHLHATNPIRRNRPIKRFDTILRSWNNVPYIAIGSDGRMIGYIVASIDKSSVVEITGIKEGEPAFEIARAWTEQQPNSTVRFELPPWHELVGSLGKVAESYSIHSSGNWLVVDWATTLHALLNARLNFTQLIEGRVIIEILSEGKFALQIDSEGATCQQSDEESDISLDAKNALRLLFGPLPPETVIPQCDAFYTLSQWCPLPLNLLRQDAV
ncbi:MAG: hypothetical protein CME10_09370 [Gemmatimonadetes bacterium]|nr:hypothetical protein [Gemmatimonadota bacterium]